MKILYIHQYFCPPGGSGNNRSFELAKNWVLRGNHVTILTTTSNFPSNHPSKNKFKTQFEVDGINVIALNVPYSHFFGFWGRIFSFLFFFALLGF